MACFADTNVSQGSVATHVRCGGIFNIRLTANLQRNLPVIKFLNRFNRIMVMSLWSRFFGPPCTCNKRLQGLAKFFNKRVLLFLSTFIILINIT